MNLRLWLLDKDQRFQILKQSKLLPSNKIFYLEELHCSKGGGARQPEAED